MIIAQNQKDDIFIRCKINASKRSSKSVKKGREKKGDKIQQNYADL